MKFFLGVLTGALLLNWLKTHALLSPATGNLGMGPVSACGDCGSVLHVKPGAGTFPQIELAYGSVPAAKHPGTQTGTRAQVLAGLPNNGLPQNPEWQKRLLRGAPTNIRLLM